MMAAEEDEIFIVMNSYPASATDPDSFRSERVLLEALRDGLTNSVIV